MELTQDSIHSRPNQAGHGTFAAAGMVGRNCVTLVTDTSEKGLETLIMRYMTGTDGLAVTPNRVALRPPPYGGTGYTAGTTQDYDRAHAIDVPQLFAFLRATQPEAFKKLAMLDANDARDINRLKFLARLSAEIGKRGVIDVPRKGVAHGPLHFDLFFGTPSPGNVKAEKLHAERSGDLRKFIQDGKKIIVSTVQKFPFILDVLKAYTPVDSYYKLVKKTKDPEPIIFRGAKYE